MKKMKWHLPENLNPVLDLTELLPLSKDTESLDNLSFLRLLNNKVPVDKNKQNLLMNHFREHSVFL